MDFLRNRKTLVMGILNVTPDSFSDGGLYYGNVRAAIKRAKQMAKEGADIIDVGGESTRPGSVPISVEEELKRVLPVVRALKKSFGKRMLISVDTCKARVAEKCLKNGADMINSVGGFKFDARLADVVASFGCPIAIYHIKGEPSTMQSKKIIYRKGVIPEIKDFFQAQINYGLKRGVKKSRFILDPGIGFGKSVRDNLEIIRRFKEFKSFNMPLLIGVSRKSHLGLLLLDELGLKKTPPPQERIEAGLAEVGVAVLNGAKIVRTHDILATKRFLAILDKLNSNR
ncbi:MAG: dihydropteroate synthase [Candidatus Colwellbacteria bacterium RIFCSPLOWO2_01_FULL_48_10]|uniref:Dihydropteroate synthase n=1 Tax=Candidatus Colwellbacteria bacterium RIFCSPLOWO2_01_FULL_48_10 TaxID=1797690 RepID=A0A1G1Z4I5_9BACT|nr:MAG: dihydropteroate synthase [Candidatus Colwellbacteria bacterium RIFCSPLOWO2_01_FULL_48_10]